MSSFLRKAMWPSALIIGMFVMIGAIGTATAPTASAAASDVCDILGPYPSFSGLGSDNTNNLLIEKNEYLFMVLVEDQAAGAGTVDVEIDDETSRVGLTGYNAAVAETSLTPLGNTDSVALAVNDLLANYDADYIGDLEDQFLGDQPAATDTIAEIMAANECTTAPAGAAVDGVTFVTVSCDRDGTFEITANETGVTDNVITEGYECVNAPSAITLTVSPATVESYPAIGNVSHSLILGTLTDGSGHYVSEGYTVEWSTNKCTIEPLDSGDYISIRGLFSAFATSNSPGNAGAIEVEFDSHGGVTASGDSESFNYDPTGPAPRASLAAAVLHCEGADPGTATVTARVPRNQVTAGIEMGPSTSLTASADVTVIGPPAFITMVAEPTNQVCGEKSQILITVTDALNQNVSDHTRVELITNYGGVIGGTGSSLGFPGVNPVNPLSSSAAETFSGVATAFLLTSTNHIGSYEVVAAAGGSNLGGYNVVIGHEENGDPIYYNGSTGVFSTAVITNQVTVTCTAGAPDVTAPDTGTGTISPPNTGDAGLASRSAGSASLLVIAGAAAFVLAGFAKFGFARR